MTTDPHLNNATEQDPDVTYKLTLDFKGYWDVVTALRTQQLQDELDARTFSNESLKKSYSEDAARRGRLLAQIKGLLPEPQRPALTEDTGQAGGGAKIGRPRLSPIQELRHELMALGSVKVGELLDRVSAEVGRRVYTVPQALAALKQHRAQSGATAQPLERPHVD